MKEKIKEIWKDIPGFEGPFLYQVSNMGRVRSMNYRKSGKPHVMKSRINKTTGYRSIYFAGGRTYYIHRLVAAAFIPNPDNLPQVNHIDEDKSNNVYTNLEWCSRTYNVNYGTAKERRLKTWKSNRKPKYKKIIKIIQYNADLSVVNVYGSLTEAAKKTGINLGNISSSYKHRNGHNTAGGYYWKKVIEETDIIIGYSKERSGD